MSQAIEFRRAEPVAGLGEGTGTRRRRASELRAACRQVNAALGLRPSRR